VAAGAFAVSEIRSGFTIGRDASCTQTHSTSSSTCSSPAAIEAARFAPPTTIFFTFEKPNIFTMPSTLSARSRLTTTTIPSMSGHWLNAASEYASTGRSFK
jgi:hypothetical protein